MEAEAKKVKDNFLANWLKISHSTLAGLSEYHSGSTCKKRIIGLSTPEEGACKLDSSADEGGTHAAGDYRVPRCSL